uniref:Uncharacterized protein n=1 Tax=Apteryx owenii TaxID=8824 RepID=A0A8B9Q9Y1_APTOW
RAQLSPCQGASELCARHELGKGPGEKFCLWVKRKTEERKKKSLDFLLLRHATERTPAGHALLLATFLEMVPSHRGAPLHPGLQPEHGRELCQLVASDFPSFPWSVSSRSFSTRPGVPCFHFRSWGKTENARTTFFPP